MKARALRPGDVVGIIAPASPPRSEDRIEKSVRYFERLGYRVELGQHLRAARGYLAGSDEERLHDLHAMFGSKSVRAIFYHRGGYGSIRLLDRIDYDLVRQNPKIIVGYSDATSLFASLYKKARLRSCFFGPMPGVDLWDEVDPFTEENFWRAVTSTKPIGALPYKGNSPSYEAERNRRGLGGGSVEHDAKASNSTPRIPFLTEEGELVEGRMIGGNLTVFCSLMGTPYQPSFSNVIPILEEIDEKPRKVDAMLAQLRLAGLFEKATAVLLGNFTGCDRDPDAPTLTLSEIFGDSFSRLKKPVISGLPFGHEKQMWTLPFGVRLRINFEREGTTVSVVERVLE